MLKIITGRAGTGKTRLLREELRAAMRNGREKAVLLVPEQFTLETERELLSLWGNREFASCEVLSFLRLAHRVLSKTGGVQNRYLGTGGKMLVLTKALKTCARNLKIYGNIALRPEFARQIAGLSKEFKNQKVTGESFERAFQELEDETLKAKLFDVRYILSEVEKIEREGFFDPSDELTLLANALAGDPGLFCGREIFIDGFFAFDEREIEILKALMKRSDVTIALTGGARGGTDYLETGFLTRERLLRLARDEGVRTELLCLEENKRTQISGLLFLEQNFLEHTPASFAGGERGVFLHGAENPFSEADRAAREILRLVREKNCRFSEIAVLASDFDGYIEILRAVFSKYEIPYFADRTDDILSKSTIAAILSALSVLMGRRSYKDMFRWIKSGFAGIGDLDAALLENYAVTWDLKYSDWGKEPWTFPVPWARGEKSEEEKILLRLNELKESVMEKIRAFEREFAVRREANLFCTSLYEFLREISFPEKLEARAREAFSRGDFEASSEYERLFGIFIEILELVEEIYRGEEMTPSLFFETLKLALAESDMGHIPPRRGEVTVGKIERVRTPFVKYVFVLGANEGFFPRFETSETIFSDREKLFLAELGFSFQTTFEKESARELLNIYSTVSSAGEGVFFFYSLADARGRAKRPSRLIARLLKIFPGLEAKFEPESIEEQLQSKRQFLEFFLRAKAGGENSPEMRFAAEEIRKLPGYEQAVERLLALGAPGDKIGDPALLRALYGEDLSQSATRIEKFNSCRFSYFMEYALAARAVEKTVFDPARAGLFIHSVLEEFMRALKDEGLSIGEISDEKIDGLTARTVEGYIETLAQERLKSERTGYVFRRLSSALNVIARRLRDEFRSSDFVPLDFELVVGDEENGIREYAVTSSDGITVKTRGVIDRVDGLLRGGDFYLRVVDYKTGSKNFDLVKILNGLDLQLLLYLFALLENGEARYHKKILPGGALYFPAKEVTVNAPGRMEDEKIESERRMLYRMNGVLLDDDALLRAMDKESEGKSAYIPAQFTKDGGIDRQKSDVVSSDELLLLKSFIEGTLFDSAREIFSGETGMNPYEDGEKTACDFCEYRPACLFDAEDPYRRLKRANKEEIWEKFGGEKG